MHRISLGQPNTTTVALNMEDSLQNGRIWSFMRPQFLQANWVLSTYPALAFLTLLLHARHFNFLLRVFRAVFPNMGLECNRCLIR